MEKNIIMEKEQLINTMKLNHRRLSNELEEINNRHSVLTNLIAEYEYLIRIATDNDLDKIIKEDNNNA